MVEHSPKIHASEEKDHYHYNKYSGKVYTTDEISQVTTSSRNSADYTPSHPQTASNELCELHDTNKPTFQTTQRTKPNKNSAEK